MRTLVRLACSVAVLVAAAIPAFSADVYVQGYTRKDGTYVAPYYRTSPDGTTLNNYSTKGNVNPYTGQLGTKDPYSSGSSSLGSSYSNPYATPAPSPYASPYANPYASPYSNPYAPKPLGQ